MGALQNLLLSTFSKIKSKCTLCDLLWCGESQVGRQVLVPSRTWKEELQEKMVSSREDRGLFERWGQWQPAAPSPCISNSMSFDKGSTCLVFSAEPSAPEPMGTSTGGENSCLPCRPVTHSQALRGVSSKMRPGAEPFTAWL